MFESLRGLGSIGSSQRRPETNANKTHLGTRGEGRNVCLLCRGADLHHPVHGCCGGPDSGSLSSGPGQVHRSSDSVPGADRTRWSEPKDRLLTLKVACACDLYALARSTLRCTWSLTTLLPPQLATGSLRHSSCGMNT